MPAPRGQGDQAACASNRLPAGDACPPMFFALYGPVDPRPMPSHMFFVTSRQSMAQPQRGRPSPVLCDRTAWASATAHALCPGPVHRLPPDRPPPDRPARLPDGNLPGGTPCWCASLLGVLVGFISSIGSIVTVTVTHMRFASGTGPMQHRVEHCEVVHVADPACGKWRHTISADWQRCSKIVASCDPAHVP